MNAPIHGAPVLRAGPLGVTPIFVTLAVVAAACRPSVPPPGPFQIGAAIEVGDGPHGIRFSADGDTAYVALSGDGQIAVVDLSGPAVVARWDAGTTPLDLIRAGDGWLVSQFRDSTLVALDAEGRIVPGAVWNVGAGPSLFTSRHRARPGLDNIRVRGPVCGSSTRGRVRPRHPTQPATAPTPPT